MRPLCQRLLRCGFNGDGRSTERPYMSLHVATRLLGLLDFRNLEFHAWIQLSNEILQPLVGEFSWSKHIVILSKCKETQQKQFYILATKKYGLTSNDL